jgi:hypothetical protein
MRLIGQVAITVEKAHFINDEVATEPVAVLIGVLLARAR